MLLKITNQCEMMCIHCMANATKKGTHMSKADFHKSIELANTIGSRVLIISGGEPTDHPFFREFLRYALATFKGLVTITTHGKWMFEDLSLVKSFPEVMWQVTNDKRFYPVQFDKIKAGAIEARHKNVVFCWEIGGEIYPQGRAKSYLKITSEVAKGKGTKCFNLRSISIHNSSSSLREIVKHLEALQRFCLPAISWDGLVKMGEGDECPAMGTIYDTDSSIMSNIRASQCNDCGMLNKLSPRHLEAINYKVIQ